MSTTEQHQKDLQRLAQLRPIDDDFMRCLLKDNIPLAEFVLRIITDKKDLVITDCETQRDMKRLAGARSICLDAYGADADGKKYDLEIQKASDGADPHRARYHSSVMDVENLHSGQDFKELPETYMIFITEKDFYRMGAPACQIEWMNLATGKPFTDGEHILYVNGEYRGDSDLGKLMHDFNCMNADDMNFELVAERTRYFKENPEGVKQMCKIMEDMRNETRNETLKESAVNTAKRMIADGMLALEKIAEYAGLSLDEVKQLQADKNA